MMELKMLWKDFKLARKQLWDQLQIAAGYICAQGFFLRTL